MPRISIYELTGTGYENGWFTNCNARYRVFAGARNTKKSVDILGFEVVMKILSNPLRNVIIARQNDVDNYQSTYANIINCIGNMGITSYFTFRKAPLSIVYNPTGQKIFFRGMNNPTSITSVKAEHGFITDVYIEEAFEIKNYEDFRKMDGSIRGALPKGLTLQITLCMNTWSKEHWIYETFFKGRLEDRYEELENNNYMDYQDDGFTLGFGFGLYLHKSTFRINEFRTEEYDRSMNMLRDIAPLIYMVEGLGMWGHTSESTYPEFSDKLLIERKDLAKFDFHSTIIGIDTGLSDGQGKVKMGDPNKKPNARKRSAMTMQLTGLTSDYTTLVGINEFFHSNENVLVKKTEPELMVEMVAKIIEWRDKTYKSHPSILKDKILCYVDSADIGFRQSIELEAKKQGLTQRDILFLPSTKNRIQTRVDFERLLMGWGELLLVKDDAPNLVREFKASRKGDDGRAREDFDDHAINAHEYSWIPIMPKIRRRQDFKEH